MPGMSWVRMLQPIVSNTPTGHQVGDIIAVNNDIARRYIEGGIAEPVDPEAPGG